MAVSLRLVIGCSNALLVLIVAAVTLAITYTVSIKAVRDTGERLSGAVTTTVALEVHNYIGRAEGHLMAMRNASKIPGTFLLPQDHPEFPNADWGENYLRVLKSMLIEVNYSYSSASFLFDDGAVIAVLDHQNARGWVTEGIRTILPGGNSTTLRQRTWHTVTKERWDDAVQGRPPPQVINSSPEQVSGYQSVKSLTAGRETTLQITYSPGSL